MSKLSGKVAVITGGSSGIGLAIAKRFVDEGAHVFITGRRQSELDRARAMIERNVTAVRGDVARVEDLDHLYATVRAEKGKVDIVVANAGIVAPNGLLSEATAEHYDMVFDINTRGTFFTVQKALPLLADGGAIVLVSSCLHAMGLPGASAYSASKAAVRSFARTWAAELKDRKIRVNSLSPGPVDTPIIDGQAASKEQADGMRESMATLTTLGRIGEPEEMASAALFLASSDSSFCNGIDLVADGGWTQV